MLRDSGSIDGLVQEIEDESLGVPRVEDCPGVVEAGIAHRGQTPRGPEVDHRLGTVRIATVFVFGTGRECKVVLVVGFVRIF